MSEQRILWVRVAEGRTVFNPDTARNLEPVATAVCDSAYWRKRIRCGDVLPAERPSRKAKN